MKDSLIIFYEFARKEPSLMVFILAETVLGMSTLNILGSEEQK